MRRFGLVAAAFGLALLAGLVLHRAGWLRLRPPRPAADDGRRREAAGLRHFQCQPRHWRYCLIHR